MLNPKAEANVVGGLVSETRGILGVVLGTTRAELRKIAGSVADGNVIVATAAALTAELGTIFQEQDEQGR